MDFYEFIFNAKNELRLNKDENDCLKPLQHNWQSFTH